MSEPSIEELRQLVYLPGDWKCDVCGFEQSNRTLHMATGDVGAPKIEEIPICPNKDKQPMRRLTWREASESNYKFAMDLLDREPRYTTDKPTEPGWYWCRHMTGETPGGWEAVVRVDYINESPQLYCSWFASMQEVMWLSEEQWDSKAQWAKLQPPRV